MSDTDGAMVGWAMSIPVIHECPGATLTLDPSPIGWERGRKLTLDCSRVQWERGREFVTAIRVSDFENRAGNRFAFGHEQFKPAIARLDDRKQRDWAMFH